MAEISGIARMNIAAMDDDALAGLRKFFTSVRDGGTDEGKEIAPKYLAAIDEEIALRVTPDGV